MIGKGTKNLQSSGESYKSLVKFFEWGKEAVRSMSYSLKWR